MQHASKHIGVINWKGGVGKTFIATHLAWLLSADKEKTLFVDLDPQADGMKWLSGMKYRNEPELKVNKYLTAIHAGGEEAFSIPQGYSYVIYDGRPQIEIINDILMMLDIALIPVKGRLSMMNAAELDRLRKAINPNCEAIVILNEWVGTFWITRQERYLLEEVGMKIFDYPIPRTVRVREAELVGKPVWKMPYVKRSNLVYVLKYLKDWVKAYKPKR